MGKMLVFSNAAEGRDDEFNKWYDEVHKGDVLSLEPFKSAKRYVVSQVPGLPDPAHRYLAIYEHEGPAKDAMESMMGAAANFQMSDALGPDALIVFVEDYEES